ncbi:MAG: M1 family metallopeptidase [Sphingobacteriaceae bacterium]
MKKKLFYFLLQAFISTTFSGFPQTTFSRADSLRGNSGPLRTCYDIRYYHLDIQVDIAKKWISGTNLFRFTAKKKFDRLQLDLFENMTIQKIVYKGVELPFVRDFNAVFVQFPVKIKKGSTEEFTIFYNGYPNLAKNAPWDGGFVFSTDQARKPWVGVSCQGLGASSWWPNKDQQADEVDSMLISVTVPYNLMNVSNGRLRSSIDLGNGFTKYDWFVSYPINNYDVTINIGDYSHFSNTFDGEAGILDLEYYVLQENLIKAKEHFSKNVKPMLQSLEHWFGPYPFYRDGYKLVETPYLGMEHQSAIAYGNKYQNGYAGRDLSGTGLGLTWDYIIVHESGHEWFGNSITSKDIADMWIHESFTMYSEALFIESQQGKDAGAKYIVGLRRNIRNDRPIIGPYNVNQEGSGDMYFKGANLLQTIRTLTGDDHKWLNMLRGINQKFGLKTTTTPEVVQYINKTLGIRLTKVFDQYLRFKDIPTLVFKKMNNGVVYYRWQADVNRFNMPMHVTDGDRVLVLKPHSRWKKVKVKEDFIPDTTHFYIHVKDESTHQE